MIKKRKWALAATIAITLFGGASVTYADVHVNGYFRKDGTYVQPHYRSDPDGVFSNNFSTYGNTNPYTGEEGTKRYDDSYSSVNPSYSPLSSYWFIYNPFVEDIADFDQEEVESLASTDIEPVVSTPSYDTATDFDYAEPSEIDPQSLIEETIRFYFDEINQRNYKIAYDLWSSEWRSKHPYQAFEDGYVDVINTINSMDTVIEKDKAVVTIDLTAEEGWEQKPHNYIFKYYFKKEGELWMISKGIKINQ